MRGRPPGPAKYNRVRDAAVADLYRAGLGLSAIGRKLGIAKSSAHYIIKREGIEAPRPSAANLLALLRWQAKRMKRNA